MFAYTCPDWANCERHKRAGRTLLCLLGIHLHYACDIVSTVRNYHCLLCGYMWVKYSF